MATENILRGKKVLIVDDEQDILDVLTELLSQCKIDAVSSFKDGKQLLETGDYHIAILDIMGVNGFELLRIAKQRGIPVLMLTAHALTKENLKKSAEDGASYYAPKDEINKIGLFVADVLEAKEKEKNVWVKCIERLGNFYDAKFGGPGWRDQEKEFWEKRLKEYQCL